MKIVISGGTGFIGEPLCKVLGERGNVRVLTRSPEKVSVGTPVEWHPPAAGSWQEEVRTADVVVNLAGESIAAGRWTEKRKRRLRESRVNVTRSIVECFRQGEPRQRRLISASAVGYYGDRGELTLDESSLRGDGFLADLGVAWEQAALEAEDVAAVTIVRFGIVLGPGGGALGAMKPIFRLGLGGRLGDGKQWMPWVARSDLIRMIDWILEDPSRTGIYNVTAPNPVRNVEFTRELGEVMNRPTFLPAPSFGLRLAMGEMADEMLLASQRVVPKRALDEGFEFLHPELRPALERTTKG